MHFVKRNFKESNQSFFLFGPRGSGKSTWLKHKFKKAIYLDLLKPDLLRMISAYPERIVEIIEAEPGKKTVIIDEIQKIPELLSQIHALIEENPDLQFILTGSIARKLKKPDVNLLGGRALLRNMHPFTASELGDKFSLDRALKIGMLPLVWNSASPEETLKSYATIYLKEEVQSEGLVRNLGDFARTMEVMSFSHGSILNTTNIARECFVKRTTVENYIQITKDLLLTFTIPIFAKRAKRALSAKSKFYFFDPGVFRSLRLTGPMDRPEEIEGAALEGLVAEHLRSWIDLQDKQHNLFFWRTRSGLEVDFVVYGEKGFYAIEVKNSKNISPNDTKSLRSFKEDYPESKQILLYRGKEKLMQNDILCMPCEEFLLEMDYHLSN